VRRLLLYLAAAASVPFADVTQRLGIDFTLENSPTAGKYLPETMPGGVALFDSDNDGRLDIYFVNGARIEHPMTKGRRPDKSDRRYWNRFYKQNADGSFADRTEHAGLTGMPQNLYGMGVAAADYDNDGYTDLYVTGVGGSTLYRNKGDGTFEDVTKRASVGAGGWTTSAGFVDYDNDGRLDLFVCRYLEWSFEAERSCGDRNPGGRSYCHPDNYKGVTSLLYRNNGDGTFIDVSQQTGIASQDGKALGVAFADYDADGWIDIYVANDSVQSFLYRNLKGRAFEEVAVSAGVGFNEDGKTFAGMGVDFSDFNNDGRPDILVTDLSNERYMLYRNNGDGTFTEVTNATGLGAATLPYSGWSTRLLDTDNDGWKDIFVAQGHVMDTIERTSPNLRYKQPPLLLRNIRGRFEQAGDFGTPRAGRGAAFGDIDNDGDIDIVVTNLSDKAIVFRNDSERSQAWTRIELMGKRSNRDGIGAQIRVRGSDGTVQHHTVTSAAGYLSSSDNRVTVTLGAATPIEIVWPSGIRQMLSKPVVGGATRVTETEP